MNYLALVLCVAAVSMIRLSGLTEVHLGKVELFQPLAHVLVGWLFGVWHGQRVASLYHSSIMSYYGVIPRGVYLWSALYITAVEIVMFALSRRFGLAALVTALALAFHFGTAVPTYAQNVEAWLPLPPEKMAANKVERVIDGDTVVLIRGGERVSVRLIGVNAPELPNRTKYEFYGPEAKEYLRFWLEGKSVRVSYEGAEPKRDQYGRLLVYLWADKGSQLVNVELVSRGFARFERRYKTKYRESFKAAEEAAQRYKLGLWTEAPK
jgi:micrococcal nuclease